MKVFVYATAGPLNLQLSSPNRSPQPRRPKPNHQMLRRRPRLSSAVPSPPAPAHRRAFRSEAALEAIRSHSLQLKASTLSSSDADDQEGPASLALYNYPTFAGAYAALAARLFHQRVRRRLLVLPFSAVEPFRFLLTRSSPFRFPIGS